MASPAQLVEMLSRVTGVPLATVVDIDRKLVKAGLRTKTGRGFNAARMTPLDAARLLTAILASPQSVMAAAAVTRYAATQVDRTRSSDRLFGASGLSELAALRPAHSFIDGLTALITAVAGGDLAKLSADKKAASPQIEIFAFTRATRGRIRLSGLRDGLTASVEYAPPPSTGKPETGSSEEHGDLEQSRRVTEGTIMAIAALLAEDNSYERG